jgi:muconolactone delta-isomerase
MEFLVTMTTRVPDGVPESANTVELAAQGRVLRLWRPPLLPGEWRTLGLFDAGGAAELESLLATMPLRIWRTDEVTALEPNPNDPGRGHVPLEASAAEFLTTFNVQVPAGTSEEAAQDIYAQEADRVRKIAADGHLTRLWRLDGGRNLGHWQTRDADQLQGLLGTLPMAPWLAIETLPVTRHPSDPAAASWSLP